MVAFSFARCLDIMSLESTIIGTVESFISHTVYGSRSKNESMVMAIFTKRRWWNFGRNGKFHYCNLMFSKPNYIHINMLILGLVVPRERETRFSTTVRNERQLPHDTPASVLSFLVSKARVGWRYKLLDNKFRKESSWRSHLLLVRDNFEAPLLSTSGRFPPFARYYTNYPILREGRQRNLNLWWPIHGVRGLVGWWSCPPKLED